MFVFLYNMHFMVLSDICYCVIRYEVYDVVYLVSGMQGPMVSVGLGLS